MTRTFRTSRLAVALGVAALATAALAPSATAIPYQDLRSPDAADAARAAGDPPRVAPPASSIAASAADEYQDLRSPDALDAALAQERYLGSYGATVSQSARDLRSPDTRDAATGYSPTTASQPVVDESPASDGFDWTSAAIGAAVGAGLLVILIAVFAGTGKLGRRSIPARGQSTASA
jgi:hypothetical protein